MTGDPDDPRLAELLEATRRQAAASERIADSLARLEAQYTAAVTAQNEDRTRLREQMRRMDRQMGGLGGIGWSFALVPLLTLATFAALAIANVIQMAR